MSDLFLESKNSGQTSGDSPLADKLRPNVMSEVVGQEHLTANGKAIATYLQTSSIPSMILWGPPGCGKTTLARIISESSGHHFEQLSAIFSGIKDLRLVFESAKIRHKNGVKTILFVDEIHRFMKSQQDAFLPVVENGTITLIGATTENPSFELNSALLSRCQVFVLKRLDDNALELVLQRAEKLYEKALPLTKDARETLKILADGDGRYCLSLAEQLFSHNEIIDSESLLDVVQKRAPLYDKGEEEHYNLISALHKSVRGSDPDAALYWFARMLAGGEDPNFIARRIVRIACEDIGLADPQAMPQAIAAWQAYERLGSPEGELALAQSLVYIATAPKSVSVYKAYNEARLKASQTGSYMPPKHILNAPTKMMKEQGYKEGYIYDPDTFDSFSGQDYFPKETGRINFYRPVARGFEREINKRLDYWNKLRNKL